MARIRTIKPEFVESESIGKLSRDARLLFIQLWTLVDDAGRSRASSRFLASRLYPYDEDAPELIDGWLTELTEGAHIRLYEVDGHRYLDIPKWLEHQKIDHPSKSKIPEFDKSSENLARNSETFAPHTKDLGPGPRTKDLGPESAIALASEERTAFDLYNDACEGMRWPKAQRWNDTRRCALAKRLRECGGVDGWRNALAKARASPFLTSKFDGFSLDWMLKSANFTKIMEGNYDARSGSEKTGLSAALAGLAG